MNLLTKRKPPRAWLDLHPGYSKNSKRPLWEIEQWFAILARDGWEFVAEPHPDGYTITCTRRPENEA